MWLNFIGAPLVRPKPVNEATSNTTRKCESAEPDDEREKSDCTRTHEVMLSQSRRRHKNRKEYHSEDRPRPATREQPTTDDNERADSHRPANIRKGRKCDWPKARKRHSTNDRRGNHTRGVARGMCIFHLDFMAVRGV